MVLDHIVSSEWITIIFGRIYIQFLWRFVQMVRSRIKNGIVIRRKRFTSRGYGGITYINCVGSALNIFNLYIWFGELAFDHLFNSCAILFGFIMFGISILFPVMKTIVVLVLFSTYNHNSHASGSYAITP